MFFSVDAVVVFDVMCRYDPHVQYQSSHVVSVLKDYQREI